MPVCSAGILMYQRRQGELLGRRIRCFEAPLAFLARGVAIGETRLGRHGIGPDGSGLLGENGVTDTCSTGTDSVRVVRAQERG
jgi:hypothetical protein